MRRAGAQLFFLPESCAKAVWSRKGLRIAAFAWLTWADFEHGASAAADGDDGGAADAAVHFHQLPSSRMAARPMKPPSSRRLGRTWGVFRLSVARPARAN